MKTQIIKPTGNISQTKELLPNTKFDTAHYYGVEGRTVENNVVKGFITRENFLEGQFVARCLSAFTEGNTWTRKPTLKDCIKYLLDCPPIEAVYEFDTQEEFCRWLAE